MSTFLANQVKPRKLTAARLLRVSSPPGFQGPVRPESTAAVSHDWGGVLWKWKTLEAAPEEEEKEHSFPNDTEWP